MQIIDACLDSSTSTRAEHPGRHTVSTGTVGEHAVTAAYAASSARRAAPPGASLCANTSRSRAPLLTASATANCAAFSAECEPSIPTTTGGQSSSTVDDLSFAQRSVFDF